MRGIGKSWLELGRVGAIIQKFQKSTPSSQSNRDFFKGMKYDEKSDGIDGRVHESFGD